MHVLLLEPGADLRTLIFYLLRAGAPSWELSFAETEAEAFARCKTGAIDVCAASADLARVFATLRTEQCGVARVLLTTPQTLAEDLPRLRDVHEAVPIPCSPDHLVRALRKARTTAFGSDEALLRHLSGRLPPAPETWTALHRNLRSTASHTQSVARVILRDAVITGRVLQMANTALFGRVTPVETLEQAIQRLGVQRLEALVLSVEFALLMDADGNTAGLRHSQQLSRHLGELAQQLAPVRMKEAAYTAGTLQGLGQMLLLSHHPGRYLPLIEQPTPLALSEEREFGASSARVAAALIRSWGLPAPVVRAVRHKDRPSELGPHRFELVDALHMASGLLGELDPWSSTCGLDEGLLTKQGALPQLAAWRAHLARAWAQSRG
ncbi:MAG: HDOD domain-containing protein [Deltaproteobacteria bacterium]|nr:HDOD domain-containing protein [Deltaproteobacteria bacterium]